MKIKRKFTVHREQWWRGRGGNTSALRVAKMNIASLTEGEMFDGAVGKMCCLGFLAREVGYSEEDITGVTTPDELDNASLRFGGLVINAHSHIIPYRMTAVGDRIINTNDAEDISEEERERTLTELFAQVGYEVEFV